MQDFELHCSHLYDTTIYKDSALVWVYTQIIIVQYCHPGQQSHLPHYFFSVKVFFKC